MRARDILRARVGTVPNPIAEHRRQAHARARGTAVAIGVCPYCAVDCPQFAYGNEESPINGDTLSPSCGERCRTSKVNLPKRSSRARR